MSTKLDVDAAYCLITAFAALGLFVATLATGSRWAAAAGIGLVACMTGSVMGFRAAARKLAQAGGFDEAAGPVSIFSTPRRQGEVDRYLETYRGTTTAFTRVADDSTRRSGVEHREPALLSA